MALTCRVGAATARYRLWHGRDEAPDGRLGLTAGDLRALLVGPDVRYLRFGSVEYLQRAYVAVRDTSWNTIPGRMEGLEIVQRDGSFTVRFRQRHTHGEIDFAWDGLIEGTAEGVLTYAWEGRALRPFAYCKIGLNLHHSLAEYVGRPFRARTPSGPIDGTLPRDITPQLLVDGKLTGMFPYFDALEVDLASGVTAAFTFEGDLFEMQDHRNWADGNLKTYGTPLSLGFPIEIREGEVLRQKVTIRCVGDPLPVDETAPASIEIGPSIRDRMPAIGLGMASHDLDLTEREVDLLRRLSPDHLRVDLHLRDASWTVAWARAARAAAALGTSVEIAAFVTSRAPDEAAGLASAILSSGVAVARVIVLDEVDGFSATRGSTETRTVLAVRDALHRSGLGDCPVAGGTDQFLSELNRSRPGTSGTDGVAFSLNPQVHAGDDLSFADNLAPLAEMAAFAGRMWGPAAIHITPVTLIGRNGPFPSGPPADGALPGVVDVRQASLLGAAWTAGAVKGLAAGGADSISFYETTGWRGVVETAAGSPMPDRFPSLPGHAFPVYHVLADVADWKGSSLLGSASDAPARVDALVVGDADTVHALIYNLTPEPVRVTLGPLKGGIAHVRVLDDRSAPAAAADPDGWRARPAAVVPVEGGRLYLVLAPHAIARADVPSPTRRPAEPGR